MTRYVSSADFYNSLAQNLETYAHRRRAYLDAMNREVVSLLKNGTRIVDIGSGTGKRARDIFSAIEPSFSLCIDNAPKMIEQAEGNGVRALLHDIAEGPVPHAPFDAALCLWNVLGHVPVHQQNDVLHNIRESLHKDGLLLLDINNRYNISSYGLLRVVKNIALDVCGITHRTYPVHVPGATYATKVYLFNRRRICKALTRLGFRILDIKYIDYDTGEIVNTSWFGQMLIVAQKV